MELIYINTIIETYNTYILDNSDEHFRDVCSLEANKMCR